MVVDRSELTDDLGVPYLTGFQVTIPFDTGFYVPGASHENLATGYSIYVDDPNERRS